MFTAVVCLLSILVRFYFLQGRGKRKNKTFKKVVAIVVDFLQIMWYTVCVVRESFAHTEARGSKSTAK